MKHALELATDSALPVVVLNEDNRYAAVLNLLGYDQKDIFIDVDKANKEIGIYAGRQGYDKKSVSFWIFSVPQDGVLERVAFRYKGGAFEMSVPKVPSVSVGAA
ncbi:MAG TPA: hypothetical protein VFV50_02525 [Bdellovibrionales bacterium]|nr:hypothetical protein [Bdellovibrionales bacterium]